MQGLGSGLLPANGISPLILSIFLSLLFLYSSAAPLPQIGSLLGWSQQVASCNLPKVQDLVKNITDIKNQESK